MKILLLCKGVIGSFFKYIKLHKFSRKWNVVIDEMATPVHYSDLSNFNIRKINVSRNEVVEWLQNGGLGGFLSGGLEKKGLEFFFSSYILDINSNDTIMDAAGGRSLYLDAIMKNSPAHGYYLTDHIYKGVVKRDNGIYVVGGVVSSLPIDDKSISKIACHHAFEHFQSDIDIKFIKEAYRILKSEGVLVVIPLFITNNYVECWNVEDGKHFDNDSLFVIDKSASIPGADDDGHFARFYSVDSLYSRILSYAETLGFKYEIIECEVDGESVPDMRINFGSLVNCPTRALRLYKV